MNAPFALTPLSPCTCLLLPDAIYDNNIHVLIELAELRVVLKVVTDGISTTSQ